MKLRPSKRQPRELPTREELETRTPKHAGLKSLAVAGVLLSFGILWWAKNGSRLLQDVAFHAETLYLYWTLVASPLDRKVWLIIGLSLLAGILVIVWLLHRFVWRALFPDLKRLDPRMHRGGRPEPIGRLYRTQKFRDGDRILVRHYYKHGGRWFPLVRFDQVDLDHEAQPGLFGEAIIRCGRLERDPANRFRRTPNESPFPTHPLEDAFRRAEVDEDQKRKVNIVGPGPGTNPDVMRRKWQGESRRARAHPHQGPPQPAGPAALHHPLRAKPQHERARQPRQRDRGDDGHPPRRRRPIRIALRLESARRHAADRRVREAAEHGRGDHEH